MENLGKGAMNSGVEMLIQKKKSPMDCHSLSLPLSICTALHNPPLRSAIL